jgi:glycolate oxidase FAD binding subunit
LREQQLPFFQSNIPLWRLSVAAASAQPQLSGDWFIDWGGALRWLKSHESADNIFHAAQTLDGHACRFRAGNGGEFQALPDALAQLQRRVKVAFDPLGIFNIGLLDKAW